MLQQQLTESIAAAAALRDSLADLLSNMFQRVLLLLQYEHLQQLFKFITSFWFSLKDASFCLCALVYSPLNCHALKTSCENPPIKHLYIASFPLQTQTVRSTMGRRGVKGWRDRRQKRARGGKRGREVRAEWRQNRGERVYMNIWCWQRHQGVSQKPPVNSNTACVCVCNVSAIHAY